MLQEEPAFPEPVAVAVTAGPVIRVDRPNHVWHIDLASVPTRLGFWTSWSPWAVPQEWPFCWWMAVALDHYSRRVAHFHASRIAKPVHRDLT